MFSTFALLDLSTPDMLIIFAIILLLFGSKKLPELAKSLGTSARELKMGLGEAKEAGRELKQQVAQVTATPQAVVAEIDQPAEQLQTATPTAPVPQNVSRASFAAGRRLIQ